MGEAVFRPSLQFPPCEAEARSASKNLPLFNPLAPTPSLDVARMQGMPDLPHIHYEGVRRAFSEFLPP